MKTKKIKNDEVCAWCGIHLRGIGQIVGTDHICLRCFRDYAVDKKQLLRFWKGVKHDG